MRHPAMSCDALQGTCYLTWLSLAAATAAAAAPAGTHRTPALRPRLPAPPSLGLRIRAWHRNRTSGTSFWTATASWWTPSAHRAARCTWRYWRSRAWRSPTSSQRCVGAASMCLCGACAWVRTHATLAAASCVSAGAQRRGPRRRSAAHLLQQDRTPAHLLLTCTPNPTLPAGRTTGRCLGWTWRGA